MGRPVKRTHKAKTTMNEALVIRTSKYPIDIIRYLEKISALVSTFLKINLYKSKILFLL